MLILLKTGSVKKFDTTVQFFDTSLKKSNRSNPIFMSRKNRTKPAFRLKLYIDRT